MRKRDRKSLPVVIDGIKGDGVFSVLCLGVAVVNGALIFMIVGRTKLCKRIFPVNGRRRRNCGHSLYICEVLLSLSLMFIVNAIANIRLPS